NRRPGSSIRNVLVHRTFRFPASSQMRRERCGIRCRSAPPFLPIRMHRPLPEGESTPSMFAQIFRNPFAGSVHRLLALSPVGRTYFAVLLEMLERIDHPEHLVHITAEGQVIDDHVPHDTALVDEEQTAVSHGSSPLEEEFILDRKSVV